MRAEFRRHAGRIAWPILVTVLMLIGWEIAVRALGVRSIILPPPSAVLAVMVERRDLLLAHLWPSLYLTILGFALSVIGGILVAVLITYSSIVRAGFYPVIVVSQVIPKFPSLRSSSCGSGQEPCRACCSRFWSRFFP